MTNNNNNVCHANYYCGAASGTVSLELGTCKDTQPIEFDASQVSLRVLCPSMEAVGGPCQPRCDTAVGAQGDGAEAAAPSSSMASGGMLGAAGAIVGMGTSLDGAGGRGREEGRLGLVAAMAGDGQLSPLLLAWRSSAAPKENCFSWSCSWGLVSSRAGSESVGYGNGNSWSCSLVCCWRWLAEVGHAGQGPLGIIVSPV